MSSNSRDLKAAPGSDLIDSLCESILGRRIQGDSGRCEVELKIGAYIDGGGFACEKMRCEKQADRNPTTALQAVPTKNGVYLGLALRRLCEVDVSGCSMRAGYCTQVAIAGLQPFQVKDHTSHSFDGHVWPPSTSGADREPRSAQDLSRREVTELLEGNWRSGVRF